SARSGPSERRLAGAWRYKTKTRGEWRRVVAGSNCRVGRRRDVTRKAPRHYQEDVKENVARGVGRGGGQPITRGGDDAALLMGGDGLGGAGVTRARFDLDKRQRFSAPCHDIDFADRGLAAPGRNPEPLGDQQQRGAAFCRKAMAKGRYPRRIGRRRGLRLRLLTVHRS